MMSQHGYFCAVIRRGGRSLDDTDVKIAAAPRFLRPESLEHDVFPCKIRIHRIQNFQGFTRIPDTILDTAAHATIWMIRSMSMGESLVQRKSGSRRGGVGERSRPPTSERAIRSPALRQRCPSCSRPPDTSLLETGRGEPLIEKIVSREVHLIPC